ncbi:hypothetical protein B0J12DRAFT_730830 [Macrophomina phaseolina]|uniref:Uncharacterized protein n=1 Tax=Macrophomina phaseolina TaxID=35725 RepID=A0ABQ8G1R2_9PEZI|nr:hypothetical protein B0J12DRAFT_730830 [Macrophomina phaseolina]
MRVLSIFLGLQVALSAARVLDVQSDETEIEVISDQGHRYVKRVASSDANWCNGKIHESEGTFKPMQAVCNWALDRSYSVHCVQQDVQALRAKAYWIQGWCDVGLLCEQREEARLWNGQLGFDVDCVPSKELVKWAIGERETGHSSKGYCSHNIRYSPRDKGGRTAVWEFFASFYGTLGQNTKIATATILWKGKSIQHQTQINHIGTRHTLEEGDLIQYCGVRGSDSLIEGFATAKIVSWINDAGEEEAVDGEVEFDIEFDTLEAEEMVETEKDAQEALELIAADWDAQQANTTQEA